MQYSFYLLLICTVLLAHQANAFKSSRIKGMTRGKKFKYNTPEELGGSAHSCRRTCVEGDIRVCKYNFTLSEYTTMSSACGDCPFNKTDCYNTACSTAGGHVRAVVLINYLLPGPSIEVCSGDTVQVELTNSLAIQSTTIHWHGMHQTDNPFMDGVPMVTQCPIAPRNSFTYNFTATPYGTHFYHSHLGLQETDGLFGSLIVRRPNDPLEKYYDYDLSEHVMIVWHWFNRTSSTVLNAGLDRTETVDGYSLIVNGYGAKKAFEQDGEIYYTPRANFTVEQNLRYRFRMVANYAVYCPVQVSIDNHTVLVISADGAPFEPVEVDTWIINAGERYDFVLTADQEIGNYWIRFRGLGNCDEVVSDAILRYDGADEDDPEGTVTYESAIRSGVLLNPVAESVTDYSNNSLIRVFELKNRADNLANINGKPDKIIYLPFSFNTYDDYLMPGPYPQFNNISFDFPSFPLLTQRDEITPDMYCTIDDTSAKDCEDGYCACPWLYKLPSNRLIEVIIIDESSIVFPDDHPMHLHGQYFRVVGSGFNPNDTISLEEVRELNEAGLIKKNFKSAPYKDTIGVPSHGYVVLRFRTSNPGYWIFHCHVSVHMEHGMGVVLKVGEHHEMVKTPKGFPQCRNYDVTDI